MPRQKQVPFILIIFLLLTTPFLGVIPYLDGNIDLAKACDFFRGGFSGLLAGSRSVHPPIKEIIAALFFHLGGLNAFSYGLIGLVIGLVGVFFFYSFLAKQTKSKLPLLATFLLVTSPLFLATEPLALTDYLLTVFILISLYCYDRQKYLGFFLTGSLAILTKETGAVFIFSLWIIELICFRKNVKKILLAPTPFLSLAAWSFFLKVHGQAFWSDWNFSSTASSGTLYTIFSNYFKLRLLNPYAYQNWLQVLVLNFNWVIWLVILTGMLIYLIKPKHKDRFWHNRFFWVGLLFCLLYFTSVLSFQTYTIPRYALPMEPFILIVFAFSLEQLKRVVRFPKYLLFFFLILFICLRLFFSLDPVSRHLWKENIILGERFYGLNMGPSLSGFDGITYNFQFNLLLKKRTRYILGKLPAPAECFWIFPDPSTDIKTIRSLNLKIKNPEFGCWL